MDFTFKTYEKLLNTLLARGFSFITFAQYEEVKVEVKAKVSPQPQSQVLDSLNQQINESTNQPTNKLTSQQANKLIILRHDVEDRYLSALRMAQIEHKLGIMGSYYFRLFPVADNDRIISQIAALGHEVGYHYDDLSVCKGNHEAALKRFQKNLAHLRQFAPVTTITMEGAPLSKYDNRDLWKQPLTPQLLESLNLESSNPQQINESTNQQINKSTIPQPHYSHYGILAEPYFDLNFNQIFYLTDTGRCWDGHRYNVRDKATKENPLTNPHFLNLRFHTTFDLINAIEASFPQQNLSVHRRINKEQRTNQHTNSQQPIANSFPNQAMLNFHPQRWNDKPVPWLKELIWQNIKNQGKRLLLTLRK